MGHVDVINEQLPQLLEEFSSAQQLGKIELVESWKTSKSVYWKVLLPWTWERFFKIGQKIRIKHEIAAYWKLPDWPHSDLHESWEVGWFWIYFQDYHQWKYGRSILEDFGKQISGTSNINEAEVLDNIWRLFQWVRDRYAETMRQSDIDGENDIFFRDRVRQGGMLKKYLDMPVQTDGWVIVSIKDILDFPITINGEPVDSTIWEMFNNLVEDFSSPKKRSLVMSQGDITENNVTLEGHFYDFETGGINSITQDVAITLHYLMVLWHYLTPKYSSSFWTLDVNREQLLKNVESPNAHFTIKEGRIDFTLDFKCPEFKKKILKAYVDSIAIPFFRTESWAKELGHALAFRCLTTKDLHKVDDNDKILLLGLSLLFFWKNPLDKIPTI